MFHKNMQKYFNHKAAAWKAATIKEARQSREWEATVVMEVTAQTAVHISLKMIVLLMKSEIISLHLEQSEHLL